MGAHGLAGRDSGRVDVEVMRKTQSGIFFDNPSHLDDLSDPVVRMRQMKPIPDLMKLRFNSFENPLGSSTETQRQ